MKTFLASLLLITFLVNCDSNKQTVSENPIDSTTIEQNVVRDKFETELTADYDSILHGTWFTDGNEGVVPNWLEFDTTAKSFKAWHDDESKPEEQTGTFTIKDDRLELTYIEFNDIQAYKFDSINTNYIDLGPLGVSAGNLIYRRKEHQQAVTGRLIFFHLNEQEFDSLADLPNYQGLYEASSDFGFYVNKVLDSLKNSRIKAEITTKKIISINDYEIDKMDHYGYGLILIKPDSIKVKSGIMTDIEYFQLISEFFDL